MQQPQPQSQQPQQPQQGALVVTTDRAAVDRFYRPIVITVSVLLVVMLLLVLAMFFLAGVGSTIGDGSAAWAMVPLAVILPIILLTSTANLVIMAAAWGGMRSLGERVVADARGLALTLPGLRAQVPWQAVRSATLAGSGRRARLTLRVDEGAVQGDLPDVQRRRIAKRGLVLSGVGMRPRLDAVAHAIAVGTAGRVTPQRR